MVSHHPGPDFGTNLAALRAQVGGVLVVDNGSGPVLAERLEAWRAGGGEALFNEVNLGIATALNQGVAWARSRGYAWIATFDQDSCVTPGMFVALGEALAAAPRQDRVAIIAPRLRDVRAGTFHSFAKAAVRDAAPFSEVRLLATSGNVIPLCVFDDVGTYREDFFIDYVDQEFCLRCRRRGWVLLESRDAVLDHRYGQPTRHRLAWMRPLVTNHAATRRYYQARNRLVVYRRHADFDPRWVWDDLREFLRDAVKIVLFEQQRAEKLRAILRGTWHGLRGRLGPAGT